MKKPGAPDNADDAALFRAAVGDVKPLPDQNRAVASIPPRQPPQRAAAPETIPDILSDFASGELPDDYLSNGLSRMTLRKLRRGHWPIQDRLDLHGLDSDSARRLLQAFLHEAKRDGLRCVLVIHGKGTEVLKQRTRHWLMQHPQVLAWCDAPPGDGGGGAVLALLRAAERTC